MTFKLNPYYSPEEFGLEIVGEVIWDDDPYQFDFSVVWEHKETGEYYTARDSGCSCPTPFESFNSLEDLEGPFSAPSVVVVRLYEIFEDNWQDADEKSRARFAITEIAERLLRTA